MRNIISFIVTLSLLTSCSVVRLKRLENCEISFMSVSDARIGDIKLQDGEKMLKLNVIDYIALTGKIMAGDGDASLNVNLSIVNKGKKKAGVDKVGWTAYLNDSEIAGGVVRKHILVKPSATEVVSVPFNIDLKGLLTGEHAGNAQALASGFMKSSTIRGVKIEVRPYVRFLFFYIKSPKSFDTSLDDFKLTK